MDILEEAENILESKQYFSFAWENPENHDIIITGVGITDDNKLLVEYVGK